MIFRPISVAGRDPVQVCLRTDAGDAVVPWLLDHDWIDEPVMRLFLDCVRPGARVLDLGCHLGLFSLTAASLGAEVIAVDAVPEHAEQVALAAERNGFDRFTVVHGAIAATPGRVRVEPRSIHSHVLRDEETSEQAIEVEAVTIDALIKRAGWDTADLVKMDIEGSEIAALGGLRAGRPTLVVECNGGMLPRYGQDPAALRRRLRRRGYALWMVDHTRPGTLIDATTMAVQPECVVDLLALPDGTPPPDGWTLAPPLTQEQTAARLLDQAAVDAPGFRLYVAHVLRDGPAWLARDPLVAPGRRALAADLDGEVRAGTPAPDAGRWTPADEPPDPDLVVVARDLDIGATADALDRAPGQPRGAPPRLVVRGASFHVRRGTLLGIVGGDGAAVLDAIAGRRRPAAGSLDVRARVLSLRRPADGLEPELSVADNAALFASFAGVRLGSETLERAGLVDVAGEPLGGLSADAVLRLVLAIALGADRYELLLIDAIPPPCDGAFRDWAATRTHTLRQAGTAIVQAATGINTLLGPPDRLLDLDRRLAGHPASVDDVSRRALLGFPGRLVA